MKWNDIKSETRRAQKRPLLHCLATWMFHIIDFVGQIVILVSSLKEVDITKWIDIQKMENTIEVLLKHWKNNVKKCTYWGTIFSHFIFTFKLIDIKITNIYHDSLLPWGKILKPHISPVGMANSLKVLCKGITGYFCCVSPPGPEQPAGRPATNTGNRFSALQQATSGSSAAQDSDRRVPQRWAARNLKYCQSIRTCVIRKL